MDTAHGFKPWNIVITCRSAASASHLSPLISSSSVVIPLTHVHLFAHISHRSPETLSACFNAHEYMWFFLLFFLLLQSRSLVTVLSISSNASAHTNTHTSLLTIKNPWPLGIFTAAHPNASSLRSFISRKCISVRSRSTQVGGGLYRLWVSPPRRYCIRFHASHPPQLICIRVIRCFTTMRCKSLIC